MCVIYIVNSHVAGGDIWGMQTWAFAPDKRSRDRASHTLKAELISVLLKMFNDVNKRSDQWVKNILAEHKNNLFINIYTNK